MSEQFDSLEKKAKSFDIALKYTNGDADKAKAMVAGTFNDIIVIKGKFIVNSNNQSGMLLCFVNTVEEYISTILSVIITTSDIFDKIRVFDDWKTLLKDLWEYDESAEKIDSTNFTNFLLDEFIRYDIFEDVNQNQLNELTGKVNEIICNSFNTKSVQSQIEMENSNSLQIDLAGLGIDVPGSDTPEDEDQTDEDASPMDARQTAIESEADFIIPGKIIVSPVKGKYVNDLTEGEKIKVLLPATDLVSKKILKVLNAYDQDGNVMPINGRLKTKIPLEKSGYIIYALVAKGVLTKIIEEENVKIQVHQPENKGGKKSSGKAAGDSKLIYLMALILGLILLCVFVIFQLVN